MSATWRPRRTSPLRRRLLQAGTVVALGRFAPPVAAADTDVSRLALVVGNDRYAIKPLNNAGNDARSVASLLREAAFDVDLRIDTRRDELQGAVRKFGEAIRRPEVKIVFFYYAGHGAQLDWRNYMLPVDAQVKSAADLATQGLDLTELLTEFGRAKGRTFVVVLDACRDDPFGASFRTATQGLSQYDAPSNSLLAFATAPGNVAEDGAGRAGLYTESLVRELSVRETRIEDALKRVRLSVRIASRGRQVPWESTSLEGEVFLFPTKRAQTEGEIEEQLRNELTTWNRVKGSLQVDEWVGYLRAYPSGRFCEIAQNRLNYLLAREEAAVTLAAATKTDSPQPISPNGPGGRRSRPGPDGPPELAIASGLPVPVLMRPSPNPDSAGRYPLGRTYSIGDEVVYAVMELRFGGGPTQARRRVTRVDLDADRIEFNGGRLIEDTMGNILFADGQRRDPPIQWVPAELQVGRKWTTRFLAMDEGTDVLSESEYNFSVVARERVTVPCGIFDAFKLVGVGYNERTRLRTVRKMWIAPNFNFFLRLEIERTPRQGIVRTTEMREMVSCRQYRWSVA